MNKIACHVFLLYEYLFFLLADKVLENERMKLRRKMIRLRKDSSDDYYQVWHLLARKAAAREEKFLAEKKFPDFGMPPLVLRQRQESPSRCKMSPQRSTSSSVGLQFKKQNNNNNVNNRQLKLKKTNKRKSTKRKDKMSASSNSNFNNNVKIQTLFIACLLGIPGKWACLRDLISI